MTDKKIELTSEKVSIVNGKKVLDSIGKVDTKTYVTVLSSDFWNKLSKEVVDEKGALTLFKESEPPEKIIYITIWNGFLNIETISEGNVNISPDEKSMLTLEDFETLISKTGSLLNFLEKFNIKEISEEMEEYLLTEKEEEIIDFQNDLAILKNDRKV